MSINYKLPKSARFIQQNVELIANFNTPTLGKYDFAGSEVFNAAAVGPAPDSITLKGFWPVGTAIKFSTAATLATGLNTNVTYYIQNSYPNSTVPSSTDVTFSATLNGPKMDITGPGAGNSTIYQVYPVMQLNRGNLYFLERINIGGSLSEDDYLLSIETIPKLTLKRLIDAQSIFPYSLPIVNFIDNQECNAWIFTERDNDTLYAYISGLLSQISATVGMKAIRLYVQFNIYEISDNAFIADFKKDDRFSGGAGTVRRAGVSNLFETR